MAVGGNRTEVVLYDQTVTANIDLTYSGSYGEYYQYVAFPNYTAAAGTEHYTYIYCAYTFIGDSVYGYPDDYNAAKTAYASSNVQYSQYSSYANAASLDERKLYNIGGTQFYFNELSDKTISITRSYGTYGYNTMQSSGTGTRNFNIYYDKYYLRVRLDYGYTTDSTIYNNSDVKHRIQIVGVI